MSRFFEHQLKNLKCLGYFKAVGAVGGGKMWVYKLIIDGLEYEITDLFDEFQILYWSRKNEFEVVDGMPSDRLEQLKDACNKLDKVENPIEFDERESYFTQYEVKVPQTPKLEKIKNKTFTDSQATHLLEVLDEMLDFVGYTSDGETTDWFKITEEIRQEAIVKHNIDLFEELVGYKFKVQQDGDHRHDGQMVDYRFDFKSPSGVETMTWTEMCLMVGWNVCDEWVIK